MTPPADGSDVPTNSLPLTDLGADEGSPQRVPHPEGQSPMDAPASLGVARAARLCLARLGHTMTPREAGDP